MKNEKIDRHLEPATPHFIPEEELTDAQVSRHDAVDNAIFALLCELIPPQYRARADGAETVGEPLEWDIEAMSDVREVI